MESMYSDLYIYWINRALTEEEEKSLGKSFIGNWVEDDFSFLFFSEDALKIIKKLMQKDSNLRILDHYHMTYEQWQGELYDSIQIDKFLIIPPWHKTIEIKDGLIPISLDPGVVFGNCLHPSTRHCLNAISWLLERYNAKKVLDLGTGTGILAIAAARLGAERIIAVDINPLCIKTANKNIVLNGLEDRIETICARAEDTISQHRDADLVIANLSYEVILKLINLSDFLDIDKAILSGMLRSQWADIKSRLIKKGYDIAREWDHEMIWHTAMVIKGGITT